MDYSTSVKCPCCEKEYAIDTSQVGQDLNAVKSFLSRTYSYTKSINARCPHCTAANKLVAKFEVQEGPQILKLNLP